MTGKPKRYSADFKAKVSAGGAERGGGLSQLATKHGIYRTIIAGRRKHGAILDGGGPLADRDGVPDLAVAFAFQAGVY